MSIGKKIQVARGNLKITPLYEEWLFKHSRELWEHHRLMEKIFDRPERVREGSFSASGAGRCLRERSMAYFTNVGKEKPDAKTMNIFVNGDFVHLRHQIAGLQMGYFVSAETSVSSPQWHLTGTMDAVMDDGDIGEIKSINENGFRQVRSFGPKTEHVEQVHSYMLASGFNGARFLYENKNTNEIAEYRVARDEKIIDKVKRDLEVLIETAVRSNKIVSVADANCNNGRCVACRISDGEYALLVQSMSRSRLKVRPSTPTAS